MQLQTAALAAALIGSIPFVGGDLASRAAAQERPIKVGFTTTQSGPLAPLIAPTFLARQMWAEDVNAKGGILGRKVELVFADDKYSPGLVGTLYSKLLDVDKVDIVFGPLGNAVLTPI